MQDCFDSFQGRLAAVIGCVPQPTRSVDPKIQFIFEKFDTDANGHIDVRE